MEPQETSILSELVVYNCFYILSNQNIKIIEKTAQFTEKRPLYQPKKQSLFTLKHQPGASIPPQTTHFPEWTVFLLLRFRIPSGWMVFVIRTARQNKLSARIRLR